uniref:Intu_longin_1 domain-containing protein n=1 Tax=Ascaris lumbricoides TaxID=6252 RepID=A0A0M3ISR8_ASCLU
MSGSSTITTNFAVSNAANLSAIKGAQCRMTDVMDFFFIAHPESGRKEGEEGERIMYFQSLKPESFEKQTQVTGFAEAVVNFTNNFAGDESERDMEFPYRYVNTMKQLHVYVLVESSRFVVGIALNKFTQVTGFAEAVVNFTNNFAGDESERDMEFPYRYVNTMKQLHVYVLVESSRFVVGIALNKAMCSNEEYTLHAPTIRSIIITAYKMFRLFFGSFSKLLVADRARLKDRLEYFFSRYLSLLRLNQLGTKKCREKSSILVINWACFIVCKSCMGDLIHSGMLVVSLKFFFFNEETTGAKKY